MREKLIIWGASGHAMVVADIIRLQGVYDIIGFLDSVDPTRRGMSFCGGTILGGEEQLGSLLDKGVEHVILGFGDCAARLQLAERAKSMGFRLATAIHPTASIASDAEVSGGTVVVAAAVVNPACRIGENVILNTAATVGHESIIADGVHVCPGANLGGVVKVGAGSWIGIGASVRDHLSIGRGAYIGAGAVVVKDIPDFVVAYGNPARVKRAVR